MRVPTRRSPRVWWLAGRGAAPGTGSPARLPTGAAGNPSCWPGHRRLPRTSTIGYVNVLVARQDSTTRTQGQGPSSGMWNGNHSPPFDPGRREDAVKALADYRNLLRPGVAWQMFQRVNSSIGKSGRLCSPERAAVDQPHLGGGMGLGVVGGVVVVVLVSWLSISLLSLQSCWLLAFVIMEVAPAVRSRSLGLHRRPGVTVGTAAGDADRRTPATVGFLLHPPVGGGTRAPRVLQPTPQRAPPSQ